MPISIGPLRQRLFIEKQSIEKIMHLSENVRSAALDETLCIESSRFFSHYLTHWRWNMGKILAWAPFIILIFVYNFVDHNPDLQRYFTASQAAVAAFFIYAGIYFYLVWKGLISADTLDVADVRNNVITDGDPKKHIIGKIYAMFSFGAAFITFWQFAGDAIKTLNAFLVMAAVMGVWGFTTLILMSSGYFGWLKAKS
ncbi:hypothetical protein PQU94_02145 [Asticcacaulis sp. DXS10W]|uniref:Uncharacterized protein n=1 Tax=Asticcacaulis currens TaxID=2984210 RepID=A0ABT5IA64_9CAUL|nr:hypothetical protein [Asticcacaulis currens]MDC7693076.1 hypothetical protein [Asticcacaulis currens]